MIQKRFHNIGRSALVAALLCCCVCAAGNAHAAKERGAPGQENSMPSSALPGAITDEIFSDGVALPVYLYFSDKEAPFLRGEERSALRPGSDDPAAFCRRLMEALSAGPQSGLARTLPKDATIRAVFVEGKTAYVDFSREISISHPGGILSELMTIYSVVNTLVLNVDAVDTVKLLIAGQDAETLAGHVDIRFPLNADILLIK
jgi:hypothetical protein